MLGETALGLSDTWLVGALGPAALGGVGVATILLFLGYALIFGMMRGVSSAPPTPWARAARTTPSATPRRAR